MKKIILLLILLSPFKLYAQIEITDRVNTTIGVFDETTFERIVSNKKDTAYILKYKNLKYRTITDLAILVLNRQEITDVADALLEIEKDEHQAGQTTIDVAKKLSLTKSKVLGTVKIGFWDKSNRFTFMSMKSANDLSLAILNEMYPSKKS